MRRSGRGRSGVHYGTLGGTFWYIWGFIWGTFGFIWVHLGSFGPSGWSQNYWFMQNSEVEVVHLPATAPPLYITNSGTPTLPPTHTHTVKGGEGGRAGQEGLSSSRILPPAPLLEFYQRRRRHAGKSAGRHVGKSAGRHLTKSASQQVGRSASRQVRRVGRSPCRQVGRSVGRSAIHQVGNSAGRQVGKPAGPQVAGPAGPRSRSGWAASRRGEKAARGRWGGKGGWGPRTGRRHFSLF